MQNKQRAAGGRGVGATSVVEPLEGRQLYAATPPVVVVVNSTVDGPHVAPVVTLRDAVGIANADKADTVIRFDPTVFPDTSTQTILLDGNPLIFTNRIYLTTVDGPGDGVIVSGNNKSNVMVVNGLVGVVLNQIDLEHGVSTTGGAGLSNAGNATIKNGIVAYNTDKSAVGGGGIFSTGEITLDSTSVDHNMAGGHGGGLEEKKGSGPASVTLLDDTFSNNMSTGSPMSGGGGIATDGSAIGLDMINVTVALNSSATTGGGLLLGAGTGGTLINVTVAQNTCNLSGGGIVTGVAFPGPAKVQLGNTVVTGNRVSTASQIDPDVQGLFASLGTNLISRGDVDPKIDKLEWTTTDRVGTVVAPYAAGLGGLGINGGLLPTMLPQAGSPLIDTGNNSLVTVPTDEIGNPRIVNKIVDIGAVETNPNGNQSTPPSFTLSGVDPQLSQQYMEHLYSLGVITPVGTTTSWLVTVDWGDGSRKTSFVTSSPGNILTQPHRYIDAGNFVITVTVIDQSTHLTHSVTDVVNVVANPMQG